MLNLKKFFVNRNTKTKMVQCATVVNRDAVRRESVNGIEHVVVSSYTLPDNVVMNGGLYPADEIEAGYKTLERTLAPVEHPTDANGDFISANDPVAIHDFHAGAFNVNVTREDGRVHIEKHINVQEAMKSDRGKRLMDRITELETNENARPIHTSVGLFLEIEDLAEPMTNDDGQEYTWVARNMVFDHDAILLDSVGAAQPGQGVGMAVNKGKQIEVDRIGFDEDEGLYEKVIDLAVNNYLDKPIANAEGASFRQIMDQLDDEIRDSIAVEWMWVVDVFEDEVIFDTNKGFFAVPWRLDDGVARIVGIPVRVEQEVTYSPKTNSEGEAMKDLILNALKEAGIKTDGLDDNGLMEAYNEMLKANQSEGDGQGEGEGSDSIADAVANAVKPLTDKIDALQTQVNANADKEKEELVAVVANSGKFPGIDEAVAKTLPVESLREMAANCGSAYGIPVTVNAGSQDGDKFAAPTEMPE